MKWTLSRQTKTLKPVQFSSVQFKVVCMLSEKPIIMLCTVPREVYSINRATKRTAAATYDRIFWAIWAIYNYIAIATMWGPFKVSTKKEGNNYGTGIPLLLFCAAFCWAVAALE